MAPSRRRGGERVLRPDVEVAARGTDGEALDRHRLDDRERVALQQHPVLERAGLGLVGVAHHVVRLGGLGGDGGPLAAGRERRAAASDELRVGDGLRRSPPRRGARPPAAPGSRRSRGRRRSRWDRPARRAPAAGGPASSSCGIDGRTSSMGSGAGCRSAAAVSRRATMPTASTGAAAWAVGCGARGRHECGGTAFAEAEARRALPADPPVTRRLAFRADRSVPIRRTRPRRPAAGRRCRRRRGRRPAAAGSWRARRRRSRRRTPRRAGPSAGGRRGSTPRG